MRSFNAFKLLATFFFVLIISCVKESREPYYCGFDFKLFKPILECRDSLRIIASYNDWGLSSLVYTKRGRFLKKDTVIYSNRTPYFLSQSSYCNALRIASRVLDTSTVFVFKKMGSYYKLALIESYLTDTTFKVQYVVTTSLQPRKFTKGVLDSLQNYRRYVKPVVLFTVYDYHYDSDYVYYNKIEHYSDYTLDGQSYEKTISEVNCDYLTIEKIEYKESLLFLYKDPDWITEYNWKY